MEFSMKKPSMNLVGQKFGKLSVINLIGTTNDRHYKWHCKCECGNYKDISGRYLLDGQSQSCGCFRHDKMMKRQTLEPGLAAKRQLFRSYIYGAKQRNLKFELSFNDFISITSQKCYYDGVVPNQLVRQNIKTGNYIHNGIDRLDNTKGYTLDNCVPCCKTCNKAKMQMTEQEFYEWIDRINLWRAGI